MAHFKYVRIVLTNQNILEARQCDEYQSPCVVCLYGSYFKSQVPSTDRYSDDYLINGGNIFCPLDAPT